MGRHCCRPCFIYHSHARTGAEVGHTNVCHRGASIIVLLQPLLNIKHADRDGICHVIGCDCHLVCKSVVLAVPVHARTHVGIATFG